jgi:sugar phosphate permease
MRSSTKVGLCLVVCYLVAWLDRTAINMAIPFIATDLKLGPDKIGWILSAFFAGYALFQIPGGMLADRFGPRRVILGALGWWSVFTALTGAMLSLPALLVTRFLFGAGEGIFPASVWKTLGGWFTRRNRATANSLVISSIALGPALTPVVVAPVLALFGWRAAFAFLGVLGVGCVLLTRRFVANSIREASEVAPAERAAYEADLAAEAHDGEANLGEQTRLSDLLRTPIVWVLFAVALVFNITMYGWLNWLPSYLMKAKGLDLKGTALATSLPFVFGTVGCMAAGWISDRWFRGRRWLLVVGCQVVGGLCLFAFTRADSLAASMVLQSVAGLLLFMACGAVWTLPMVLLPTRLMGAGSGFINTGGQIGGFLTNLLIGYAISARGGDYGAGFDVMLGALAVATLLVLVGVSERRVARTHGTAAPAAAGPSPLTPAGSNEPA